MSRVHNLQHSGRGGRKPSPTTPFGLKGAPKQAPLRIPLLFLLAGHSANARLRRSDKSKSKSKNFKRPISREVNEIKISDFLEIPRTPPLSARDSIGELNSNRKSVDLNEVPHIFWTASNSAQLLKPNLADRALRKNLVKGTGRECNGFRRLNSWVSYEGLIGSYSRSPYGKMSTL